MSEVPLYKSGPPESRMCSPDGAPARLSVPASESFARTKVRAGQIGETK